MFWTDDMDRLMERSFGRPARGFWRMRPTIFARENWVPDMDVYEKDGKIVMQVDLPGMKREDIDVSVEGDMLVVRGHREEEKETKEEDYHRSERATGTFMRSIRLPEGTNSDAIQATYKEGVLEVSVPQPATPEPKELKVAVK